MLNKYDGPQDLNWPPTWEELREDSQTTAKSLCVFLETLIKYDIHSIAEKQARLIATITQYIAFALTRGLSFIIIIIIIIITIIIIIISLFIVDRIVKYW